MKIERFLYIFKRLLKTEKLSFESYSCSLKYLEIPKSYVAHFIESTPIADDARALPAFLKATLLHGKVGGGTKSISSVGESISELSWLKTNKLCFSEDELDKVFPIHPSSTTPASLPARHYYSQKFADWLVFRVHRELLMPESKREVRKMLRDRGVIIEEAREGNIPCGLWLDPETQSTYWVDKKTDMYYFKKVGGPYSTDEFIFYSSPVTLGLTPSDAMAKLKELLLFFNKS